MLVRALASALRSSRCAGRAVLPVAVLVASRAALAAPAGASPRVIRGPYLRELGPTSVEIRAELDVAAPLAVSVTSRAAGDAGAPRVVKDTAVTTMHTLRVQGLTPSTRYGYALESGPVTAAAPAKHEFTTAPTAESREPFTFLVYGDNRTDDVGHAAVIHAMSQVPADFLVGTGDFVADGSSDPDWQTFFDIEAPLLGDRCVFSCVGNHELVDGAGTTFLRYFGPTTDGRVQSDPPRLYGSFRWGTARFFLLDAMETFDEGPERAWLDAELARADAEPGLTWRFVVMHQGPWSAGPHGANPRAVRAGIPALFVRHHVDLVLSGHDHIYERGFASGLRYLVTGGGGAPLYPVDEALPTTCKVESVRHFVQMTVGPEEVALAAIRDDGSVIERCGIAKGRPGWTCDPVPVAGAAVAAKGARAAASPRCGCEAIGVRADDSALALASLGCAACALAVARRRRDRR